ncbi:Diacylglycerol kinase [Nesidiocoris tenuis]|uniref:Diacylglycerol kinase n=1 Tax=Nesidiocoris tenuis TaxID=355587 RepID=A0ABN7BCW7_9HEMI|nr:Diacylglycerol kinase [Nesidiocoris tenuis]
MILPLYQLLPPVEHLLVQVVLPATIVFGIIYLAQRFPTQSSRAILLKLRGAKKRHNWKPLKSFQYRCSSCELLLTTADAYWCDYCCVFADGACLKKVNDSICCKALSDDDASPMKHQYVPGNVMDSTDCDICGEECLGDLRCVWCHRTVHTLCRQMLGEICDFGKMKNFVIPPKCVEKLSKKSRKSNNSLMYSISIPSWASSWTPLFVVANKKSGDNMGEDVLSSFRSILNPLQVVDLDENDPKFLCQLIAALPSEAKPRVLVAGGDGTVAWVLTTMHQCKLRNYPPVAIIPLGTGNDLSRVLEWGSEEPRPFSAIEYIQRIKCASEQLLDRWSIQMTKLTRRSLRFSPSEPKKMFMYNYMSIGVDALVTLDFHQARHSRFYIYSSRMINKALYLLYGTQQVMERECHGLEKSLEVYMDGQKVDLPEIESLVLLNIPCWGAGVKLWQLGSDGYIEEPIPEQRMNDAKLEVMGIFSSFHVAQLQLGLSQPHRLGQASHVKIILKGVAPVQVDGEPWLESPCEFDVTAVDQAIVLANEPINDS